MCGEHRPHAQGVGRLGDVGEGHLAPDQGGHGGGERPTVCRLASRGDLACPVHLLGDISELEVDGKRSGEARRRREVDALEQRGGLVRVLAHEVTHLLDE